VRHAVYDVASRKKDEGNTKQAGNTISVKGREPLWHGVTGIAYDYILEGACAGLLRLAGERGVGKYIAVQIMGKRLESTTCHRGPPNQFGPCHAHNDVLQALPLLDVNR